MPLEISILHNCSTLFLSKGNYSKDVVFEVIYCVLLLLFPKLSLSIFCNCPCSVQPVTVTTSIAVNNRSCGCRFTILSSTNQFQTNTKSQKVISTGETNVKLYLLVLRLEGQSNTTVSRFNSRIKLVVLLQRIYRIVILLLHRVIKKKVGNMTSIPFTVLKMGP